VRGSIGAAALVLLAASLPGGAEARAARCETTDDGAYACDFRATDRAGSFRVTAPGKPAFILNVDEPGRGSAFANFGSRNVSLPGTYVRIAADPACWESDETHARICVR